MFGRQGTSYFNVQGQEISSAAPSGNTNNIAQSLNNVPAGVTDSPKVIALPADKVVDTTKRIQFSKAGRYAAYGAMAGTVGAMFTNRPIFKWLLIGGGVGLLLGWVTGKGKKSDSGLADSLKGLTNDSANALAAEYGKIMGKGIAQTGGDASKQFSSDVNEGLAKIESKLKSAGYMIMQKGNEFIAAKTPLQS